MGGRRTRGAVFGLAFLASLGAHACSLVIDTSGLATGGPSNAPSEATLDGNGDATTNPDGGGPNDATGDGSSDAPVKPFSCADHPTALLCSTFDMAPVDLGWTGVDTTGNGTLTLDSTKSVSPPSSFHSFTPAHANGNVFGSLYNDLDKTFSQMHVEFDVRVDKVVEPSFGITLFYFCFRTNTFGCGGYGGFTFALRRDRLTIVEDVVLDGGTHDYIDHPFVAPSLPTPGSWTHVSITVQLSASSSEVSVMLDGVEKMTPATKGLAFHTFALAPASLPTVNLGLYYVYPGESYDAWFDNFFVEVKN